MLAYDSVIAIEWALVALAAFLVVCRLIVRLWMNKDRLHVADIFLLIGLFCSCGLSFCDTTIRDEGDFTNYTDPSAKTLKLRYATNFFFDVGMYFPKFSIIAFYFHLVPPTQPAMRIVLYVVSGFTMASCLVTFFDIIFWCGLDVPSNWSTEPDACNAYNTMTMMKIHWSLNFTTEVLNLAFPFPLIRDLKLPRLREKIGLVVVLGLGIVTISVGIVRFVTMVTEGNSLGSYIWTVAELNVAIMVVALTALRPLLRRIVHFITNTHSNSDNVYPYGASGKSTNTRTKTSRAKPTLTQGSGAYWRTYSVTRTREGEELDSGSDVQLNDMRAHGIVKTDVVTITREAADAAVDPAVEPAATPKGVAS